MKHIYILTWICLLVCNSLSGQDSYYSKGLGIGDNSDYDKISAINDRGIGAAMIDGNLVFKSVHPPFRTKERIFHDFLGDDQHVLKAFYGLSYNFLCSRVYDVNEEGNEHQRIEIEEIEATDLGYGDVISTSYKNKKVIYEYDWFIQDHDFDVAGNKKYVVAWIERFNRDPDTDKIGIQCMQGDDKVGVPFYIDNIASDSEIDIECEDNGNFVVLYKSSSDNKYRITEGSFSTQALGVSKTLTLTGDYFDLESASNGNVVVFDDRGNFTKYSQVSLTPLFSGSLDGNPNNSLTSVAMTRSGIVLAYHTNPERLACYSSNLSLKGYKAVDIEPGIVQEKIFNNFVTLSAFGNYGTASNLILGANDAPVSMELDQTTIDENNSTGDIIGTFSNVDPDESAIVRYKLVEGTGDEDNDAFTIDGNNLKANTSYDFETQSSYSIRVEVHDGLGGRLEEQFTININDLQENNAPTDIFLSNNAIIEDNALGEVIGEFTTEDLDAGDSHTYSLTGTDNDNGSFSISGNQLLADEVFDYSVLATYTIEVTTDDGTDTYTTTFNIAISEKNNKSAEGKEIDIDNSSIKENEPAGTFVGELSVDNPAGGHTYTYEFAAGFGDFNNDKFSLTDGKLYLEESGDFENGNVYMIRVSTTEPDGSTVQNSLIIQLEDVDEDAPVLLSTTPASGRKTAPFSEITLNFDETIGLGKGNIYIYDLTSKRDPFVYETIDIESENVKFDKGSSITLILSKTLQGGNTYALLTDANIVRDAKGNNFEAISETNRFYYPIEKITQNITFPEIDNKSIAHDSPFTLDATASSGLTVYYRVISGPALLDGDEVTLYGYGEVTIEAYQTGNLTYKDAPKVQHTFTVGPVTSTTETSATYEVELLGYPNPSKEKITLYGVQDASTYSVYDITGQKVLYGPYQESTTINTNELVSGQYLIVLNNGSKFKFIKE